MDIVTLYHGTMNSFDSFDVDYQSSETNVEGYGVYMAQRSLATHYGCYLYEIKINDNQIIDMTDREDIEMLIADIPQELLSYVDPKIVENTIRRIISGDFMFSEMFTELLNHVDSNADFWEGEHCETDLSELGTELSEEWFSLRVFKYYDKNFSDIVHLCKSTELMNNKNYINYRKIDKFEE